MSPLLCAGRKFVPRNARQPRKSVRHPWPIDSLELCETRTLLTTLFGVPTVSALIVPLDSSTPVTSNGPGPGPGSGSDSSSTVVGSTATLTASVQGGPLVIDQAGGLLRHNQFDLGAPGYHSAFDFDSTRLGDQTLSSTDGAVSVIINASSGDDQIILGSASAPLSKLAAAFTIHGRGGSDHLILDDRVDTSARTITVSPHQVTGLGGTVSFSHAYDSGLDLQVFAGMADDTLFLVQSFDFNDVPTSLDGGGGVDTLNADAQGTETSVSATQIKFELIPTPELQAFINLNHFEQVNVANNRGYPIVPTTPLPPLNAFAGHPFVDAVVARFEERDPGAKAADYRVTIQWGDGTSAAGVVLQDANTPRLFSVLGSHRYSAAGQFTVATTIVDTGGHSASTFSA
ncbi:hypothetical protein SAMN05444166_5180 [Singulisphaera sp. GP187]|uniref:hypothetical protein n=1 Tax=Singulisphaera sp. GP187 TaxID=1882752 RepID=UPI00092B68BD|nr:hypothetical protein [Singulisphaera sp. GP187]SIO56068.1 hypothetical protein SAMN05444166_5180 [Singulisphaera sp. GP187]